MMSKTNYFYIIKNNDWNHMNAIKYGVTANPYERINKCDQHLTRNEYLHLFTFEKMNDYILHLWTFKMPILQQKKYSN